MPMPAPIMSSQDAANLEPDAIAGDARDAETSRSLLARVGRWFSSSGGSSTGDAVALTPLEVRRMHRQLRKCFEASLADLESNALARELMERYLAGSAEVRLVMLRAMALEAVRHEHTGVDLTSMLESTRIRFFKRFNALPDGLAFLVKLRADMLAHRKAIDGLAQLELDLGSLLSAWFDVGFLELQRITWDSPASLLEKLMRYEAVHEIASWTDLRNRLDSDRRCYAFFHPRLPKEPLIFVEVAFLKELAGDVGALLNEAAPLEDLTRVRWAVFYSISNTQQGLRGVSFGNFLLKRVIEALRQDIPQLDRFATLSPIPGFVDWLSARRESEISEMLGNRSVRTLKAEPAGPASLAGDDLIAWLRQPGADSDREGARRELGERLGAYYLARSFNKSKQPLDPVARFHLGNGARIERLNWRADNSVKGIRESLGLMVNYQYLIAELDDNLVRLSQGEPRLGRSVSRLLAR
jgi:malonyl-CoA decarboxylase